MGGTEKKRERKKKRKNSRRILNKGENQKKFFCFLKKNDIDADVDVDVDILLPSILAYQAIRGAKQHC